MRWRDAATAIVALFVVTRGALLIIAALLERSIPLAYHGPAYSQSPILRSLTGSDAVYYLGIAADGYHRQPIHLGFLDWVFFPLYPLVTKVASVATLGDVALAGVLVSNVAFIGALAVLYRLSLRYLDHATAVRSLAFVAFAPGAVAFAMAYSDSLFLLLASAAFLAAEERRWWLMALCYGLASLTRLQGIVLGIPLLLLVIQASGTWRTTRLTWLLAGPVAFAGFAAYLGATVGDPLGMLHAQQAWSDIGNPSGAAPIPVLDRFDPIVLLLVGMLVLYVFLLVYFRPDRVPPAYAAMAGIALLTVFVTLRLQSVTRYLAVVWPFGWVLANRRAAWFQVAGIAAFAALFVIHAVLNFTQALAP